MSSHMGEAPCKCHDSLRKVLTGHSGHCCFRDPHADCHEAEVAAWESRYEAAHGKSPRVEGPYDFYGNFVG